ncbi:hypothetical protein MGN70_014500 [Eutypa lata]|nr:hypothetical protein MGN70_014500 [Eutypa lata]
MVSSTDLGPLTASPALPESCMQEYDTIYKIHTTPDGFYWLQGGALETSCFPSGYAALSEQYYSPASCPSGFTAACQSENAIADVTETVQICCPTQYDYSCQDTTSYEWEKTLGCVNRQSPSSTTTWTVVTISDGTTATRMSAGLEGGINAYSIQVRFQSSDFASTTSSSTGEFNAATASTASISESSSTTTTSISGNDNSNNDADQGAPISTGAAVGIAIGAFAGLVLIIGAVVLFARRQRRNKNLLPIPPQPVHEMAASDMQQQPPPPPQQTQYKYYQPVTPELHSTSAAVEMEATPSDESWEQRRYA